ncbi:AcrB/AcrD/AcrF family protein [Sphingomonas sp. ABOLE]|uniref:AcrB/AcrD/AcrF family protein n=1 Tax=Sphingomonas sp. ABOLE TaxID=1985878 RepID=UPI000F7D98C0|nr:AcrB/AcrD/AcrF family protein [Sphingomonas sp. ABOLE]RSV39434.1 AcrB/AcrD/AcrF family protein [Sphingomonas sp. ABOLE]
MTANIQRLFRLRDEFDRHWLLWTLVAWACVTVWFLVQRQGNIYWLTLGDTDDNMRLMQVRALLAGQGWYDLRQYRMDPALGGFDIHWSRIVDLPIAGLILLLKPFVGMATAEKWACGLAPLLPLSITMTGLALTVRRLVSPFAWPIALVLLVSVCTTTLPMYAPLRIDHHGWQLAALAMTVAGIADPKGARGGAVVGLASAFSLSIGLELLPFCAMAGAILALRWVWDAAERARLMVYGLTLGGGSAIGFAAFASYANQAMRCDALTPVWLSVLVAAGALLVVLTLANPAARWVRLALAVVAGGLIVAGFVHFFPQCLGRPEQVSDELYKTWLSNVREARPIYRHPADVAVPVAIVAGLGLLGALLAVWHARRSAKLVGWVAVALFTAFAAAMLLWQMRAAPGAQLLAVPGITALIWILVPLLVRRGPLWVRIGVAVLAFVGVGVVASGVKMPWANKTAPRPGSDKVRQANIACTRTSQLRTLNAIPAATMFTQVDLGPRLIVVTHHNAVAGPYHRNGQAILDVHHAFTGTADGFRPIAARHKAAYLLLCPNMAETTVYRSHNPVGFYAQLAKGRVPDWLEPVALPDGSPYKLWKIRYQGQ